LPESEVKMQETAKNLPKLFLPQRKFKKVQGQSLPIEKEVRLHLHAAIDFTKFVLPFFFQIVSTLMEYGCNKVNLLDDTQQVDE